MGRYHAASLAGYCPSAELVRVVDADETVAQEVGRDLGIEWSTSFNDLIKDESIDAVVIAVPTSFHADLIIEAAGAGKHVFCEKPISLERQPTVEAIAATRGAGIKLQIGFHRRFDPDWAAATSRIRAGDLGEVYLFRTSLRDMKPPTMEYIKGSGGFFIDVTIHDFDTARWMVGEIDEVMAFGAALSDKAFAEVEDIDNALIFLRFHNGALGVIDNSRVAGYGYECSTEVMGSKATVRVDNPSRVHMQWLTPGQAARAYVESFIERYPIAYRAELEQFALAVCDDLPVPVTGEDALAAFDLCTAAHLSMQQRRPVSLRHESGLHGVAYEMAGT
jgi:inositol 2-dehydrogenase